MVNQNGGNHINDKNAPLIRINIGIPIRCKLIKANVLLDQGTANILMTLIWTASKCKHSQMDD